MDEYKKIQNSKYEINMMGDVRRIYKNGNISYLKHYLNSNGYYEVTLDNRKKHRIHRLLGIMFIDNPDPENKNMIDHIDRNRQNNDLHNLRWVTCAENNENKEVSNKGCISTTYDKVTHKGKEYQYTYYRAYIYINKKKKSKRFKNYNDAIEYLNSYRLINNISNN
jgi:hypothetical protein